MIEVGKYNFIFKQISCGDGCIFRYTDYKELFLLLIFALLLIWFIAYLKELSQKRGGTKEK